MPTPYDPYARVHEATTFLDPDQSLATCVWLAALVERECRRLPRRHVRSLCVVHTLPSGQAYTLFLPQN